MRLQEKTHRGVEGKVHIARAPGRPGLLWKIVRGPGGQYQSQGLPILQGPCGLSWKRQPLHPLQDSGLQARPRL